MNRYIQNSITFIDKNIVPLLLSFTQFSIDILDFLIEFFKTKKHGYNATFDSGSKILSRFNNGICVDGLRKISTLNSFRNTLVCASTGMGKSSVIAIPSIINSPHSLIINDPSNELYNTCASYKASKGAKIFTLNFADSSKSDGLNPLSHIHTASDASKIASLLVRSVLKNSGEIFWNLQATSLISLAIQVIKFQSKELQTFANVRYFIQLLAIDPSKVDMLVAKTNSAKIIADYKSFISYEVKVRKSIEATSLSALSIFADPEVAKVTSFDTIPFHDFRKSQHILFLHSKTSDMSYYATLISIVFELLCKDIMHELPKKNDLPIFFILDETSSLYLPSLSIVLSNIRKNNGSICLILQDFQQLIAIYGKAEAEAMRTNTFTKIYFGGCTEQTAKELSLMLGKYEWVDEKGNKKIRELLTSDEIRMLPNNRALLIASNHRPILLKLKPYYENPFMKRKTELPILVRKSSLPISELQTI